MRNRFDCEFVWLFRLRGLFLLTGVGASLLAGIGLRAAAVGLLIGVSLFVVASFFLYEAARALIRQNSKGTGRAIAAISSLGRLLFLAVALALVSRLGQVALCAACGGLLLGQIYFHLAHMKRRAARCSNT